MTSSSSRRTTSRSPRSNRGRSRAIEPSSPSPEAGPTATTTRISLRVLPRACRDDVSWQDGGGLRIRVGAPPEDGRANEAVVETLAAALALPRHAIRLVAGARSRVKIAEIDGLTLEAIRQRLERR
ncbi:MAG: DUF167 domain-containing protein [Armatimonadetes bacterium]|nr:DUF167 domain-containing protein [Armatimonadota bacterium]